jgi:hypothetical protein
MTLTTALLVEFLIVAVAGKQKGFASYLWIDFPMVV